MLNRSSAACFETVTSHTAADRERPQTTKFVGARARARPPSPRSTLLNFIVPPCKKNQIPSPPSTTERRALSNSPPLVVHNIDLPQPAITRDTRPPVRGSACTTPSRQCLLRSGSHPPRCRVGPAVASSPALAFAAAATAPATRAAAAATAPCVPAAVCLQPQARAAGRTRRNRGGGESV